MKFRHDPPGPHKGLPVFVDGTLFVKMTAREYEAAQAHWPVGAYCVRVYVVEDEPKRKE